MAKKPLPAGIAKLKPAEINRRKKKLVEALGADLSTPSAFRYAGLDEESYTYLCQKDPHFQELCENARGLVELQAILNVSGAVMDGDIPTSKWLLERVNPKYTKKTDMNVSGVPIQVPIEEKEKELEKILSHFGVIEGEVEVIDEQ